MAMSSQRTLFAALLSLASLLGCEDASHPRGVSEPVWARVEAAPPRSNVKLARRVARTTTGVAISEFITNGERVHLQVGKYELIVPRGAVKQPTRFVMMVLDNDMIGVTLYAYDQERNPVSHFHRPLQLTLPYDDADADEIGAADQLYIANVAGQNDPGILELASVQIDRGNRTVTGTLRHFSVWSLALEFSKELSPAID